MKKIVLSAGIFGAMFFTSHNLNGQIVVKETAKDSVVWNNKLMGLPKLVNFYTTEESRYTIYYQNGKYTTITDIDYISLGDRETTIQFFTILQDVLTNGEKVTIELDGKMWIIDKAMSNVSIWSSTTMFYLTKKNVETILATFK